MHHSPCAGALVSDVYKSPTINLSVSCCFGGRLIVDADSSSARAHASCFEYIAAGRCSSKSKSVEMGIIFSCAEEKRTISASPRLLIGPREYMRVRERKRDERACDLFAKTSAKDTFLTAFDISFCCYRSENERRIRCE